MFSKKFITSNWNNGKLINVFPKPLMSYKNPTGTKLYHTSEKQQLNPLPPPRAKFLMHTYINYLHKMNLDKYKSRTSSYNIMNSEIFLNFIDTKLKARKKYYII